MNDIANFLREAQVKSYTVATQDGLTGKTARGTYVQIDLTNGLFTEYIIAGDQVARASGADQRENITDFAPTGQELNDVNLQVDLTELKYDSSGDMVTNAGINWAGTPKIMNFAPDGRIYFLQSGNVTTAAPTDYNSSGSVKIFVCDQGTDLEGQVTINSVSGIIETSIKQGLTTCP